MLGELKNQFTLTRAAPSTCRAKKQIPISPRDRNHTAMRRTIHFICFTLLCASFTCPVSAEDFTNALRAYLRQYIEIEKINIGIAVGFVDEHGSRVVSCGRADNGSSEEVNGDTLFEIGSVTKTFTTLLLQDMIEQGRMRLDDPVAKYLPRSVRVPTRNGKPVTLLQLATHTSGLPKIPDNLDPVHADNPYADYAVEKMYAFLSRYQPPRNSPDWQYSTLGIGLLDHVITLAAGTNYESLVVDRICGPLKMNSTRITLAPELQSHLATGHNPIGEAVPGWDFPTLAGAGALRSTANDLLKYVAANLGFTPSTLTPRMTKTHAVHFDRPNGPHVGLAWFTTSRGPKTTIILHDGRTLGCSTFVGFDKARRRGVVILSNSTGVFDVRDLGIRLIESDWDSGQEISAKLPKMPEQLKRPRAIKLEPKLLDSYTGHYQFSPDADFLAGAKMTIWRQEDRLFLEACGENIVRAVIEICPESETNFFFKVDGAPLTFIKNGKGEVTSLLYRSWGGLPRTEGKKMPALLDRKL
jgi:CubicO group peptidase (beta-lactamase class C family)